MLDTIAIILFILILVYIVAGFNRQQVEKNNARIKMIEERQKEIEKRKKEFSKKDK
jgi:flagellar biogenesis protein FliO